MPDSFTFYPFRLRFGYSAVRGRVTVNTLPFSDKVESRERLARRLVWDSGFSDSFKVFRRSGEKSSLFGIYNS